MSHNCSGILMKNLVAKKEGPSASTISCTIGAAILAMCYDLMPLAIFQELRHDTPSPKMMRLLMDDRSIRRLVVILHDALVKEDMFIQPTNLMIFYGR